MTWMNAKLDELIEQSGSDRAGKTELPILSITSSNGLIEQSSRFAQRMASADTSNYRVVRKGELVVGFPIDEGALGFQNEHDAAIVSPAYTVWKIRDPGIISVRYLERFLRSRETRFRYAAKLQAGVARRRRLSPTEFLSIEVPVPPLMIQHAISATLDEADRMVCLNKKSLTQLDELSVATFVSFFGDPESNPNGWDKIALKDLGQIQTGSTPPKDLFTLRSDARAVEWVTSRHIREEAVHVLPTSEYAAADAPKRLRVAEAGSILITCIAGTIRPIGQIALANRKLSFNQQINAFTPGPLLSSIYAYFLLKSSRERLREASSKGMHKLLSKGALGMMRFITPPLDVQAAFVPAAEALINAWNQLQKQRNVCQELVVSLERAAFAGTLRVRVGDLDVDSEDFASAFGELNESLVRRHKEFLEDVSAGDLPAAPTSTTLSRSSLLHNAQTGLEDGRFDSPFTFTQVWQAIVAEDPDASYEAIRVQLTEAVENGKLLQVFDEKVGSVAFVLV